MPDSADTPPLPEPGALFAALHATWPAAEERRFGPFVLRRGAGGGRRVSSATLSTPPPEHLPAETITEAESAMREWGQAPGFMIRRLADPEGDAAEQTLAAALVRRSYTERDPTVMLAAPLDTLLATPRNKPGETLVNEGAPLRLQEEIWAEGGIGPARLGVMGRVRGPRAFLLSRKGQRPGGVGFVAVAGDIGFLHALFVPADLRGRGHGRRLLGAAAAFAGRHGARHLAVVTTGGNLPARQLFVNAGMTFCGGYTYLVLEETGTSISSAHGHEGRKSSRHRP